MIIIIVFNNNYNTYNNNNNNYNNNNSNNINNYKFFTCFQVLPSSCLLTRSSNNGIIIINYV